MPLPYHAADKKIATSSPVIGNSMLKVLLRIEIALLISFPELLPCLLLKDIAQS